MAKIWRERLDLERHRDFMTGAQAPGGCVIAPTTSDGWVYFVRDCAFTFQFASIEQIREVHSYLSRRTHAARRVPGVALEHYWQHWFERLPAGLTSGSRRLRVLRALERALATYSTETQTGP